MGGRRFMGGTCRKFYKEMLGYLVMKKEVTFGGVFGDSWNLFTSKFGLFALLAFVFYYLPTVVYKLWALSRFKSSGVIAELAPIATETLGDTLALYSGSIVIWVLGLVMSLSIIYVLNVKSKKGLTFGKMLKGGFGFLVAGILVSLLLIVFLIPLFILLIIPGIIFGIYWTFSLYALVIDKTSISGALKKSHDVVRGRWWKVFGYVILLGLIVVIFSGITGAIFGVFGIAGYFLQTAVVTLTSVFSAVFMNTFYLGLKGSK